MRYAISTSPQRCTWDWLLEVWRKADEIELFESGWTFDHFYPLFGDSTEDCLEGWISLTALLQETKRIRGGVLVTGMLYRHPAVLANMASTLDITSNGRLELGIGAGWNEEECEAYGIELGSMEERFDRFEEGMEVVTQLLKQDRSTFRGNWYSLQDAMNNPKGPQNPLPICIGGGGLRRTIPAVAKYAHHWNYGTQTMSLEDFKMRRNVFLKACEKEERDPDDILISTMLRYDGDAQATIQQAREYEEAGVKLGIVSIPKDKSPEIVEEIAEILA
ncbi:MAG: TIGR03560 family F420-dependent LLM class oxidoreductase [Actinomycetota bacterium]|nr:TIGR03560 family F420-dependent LLM class oxidoreductase [Actinomycetota bacterium]MEC7116998.1 TIGR03560 family F420-dependent LLM class oxidoreductase [Actinomycetota bacterium]MEC7531532.1 TIGR03560 family F420-dependent LLM class oxidoreductase [Actinomycetota bacterium]MEC8120208.1 TIGR03560 family F420-dependent LLM class oxidoreductase [Actinomycetota bacterium]MEC8334917.1 TIGR03560 family F420-dependent LLM class oxidoreductase [Actinomycetota bacterium]|tara:strand:- start:1354 stop:2181 length:828 start_codon:yes stop_codon:yes gene_type:complete